MTPLKLAQRKVRTLEQRLKTAREQLKECRAKVAPRKKLPTSDRHCDLCRMSFTSAMRVDCLTPNCKLNDKTNPTL